MITGIDTLSAIQPAIVTHSLIDIKTAESSNKRLHAFCGNCGTPIYACAVDNPQSYGLRIGTITQRAPSHRGDKAGDGLHCLGWVRSLRCQRPKEGDGLRASTPSHCLTVSFLHLLMV